MQVRRGVAAAVVMAAAVWGGGTRWAAAQVVPVPVPVGNGVVGGVYVEPDGSLRQRKVDAKELEAVRKLARDKAGLAKVIAAGDGPIACVSLPKALAKAKEALAAGKALPEDVKYLGGLTRVRYVFAFPEERDLVIAGPAETFDAAANPTQPLGKATGRPVLQLEDFVVAMRATRALRGGGFIGCSIDNKPGGLPEFQALIRKYENGSREVLKAEIAKQSAPQTVSVIGVPENSRLALALVAADYRLKTICMNIEPSPVAGIGHIVSDERTSAARLWYEMSYQPISTSQDGTAFEFRGPRVKVLAGSQMYDVRGATKAATDFAESYSKHIDELAAVLPEVADLQNVADMVLLAGLIGSDKLDRRVEWDTSFVFDDKAFAVTSYNVPRTTPTLVGITGRSVVRGGVSFSPGMTLMQQNRAKAEKEIAKKRPVEGFVLPAEETAARSPVK